MVLGLEPGPYLDYAQTLLATELSRSTPQSSCDQITAAVAIVGIEPARVYDQHSHHSAKGKDSVSI